MKQSKSPRRIPPYEQKVKEMRLLAKTGDPEAVAYVEKLNARVREAKLKIPQDRMRGYWNRYNREERESYRASRDLAAAGDAEAQKAVDEYRAVRRAESERKRRKSGMLTMQARTLYVKEAAQPEHIKIAKANAYAKEYQRKRRQKLKDAVAAGDMEAKAAYDKLLATNRLSQVRWLAKKRREKVGVPE